MKTLKIFTIISLVLFLINNSVQAQVIDVCGNDSIKLTVSNYQYGTIEWETSFDNITWEKIQGANDTVYKFLPSETKYYRAVVKFSECAPEYSETSFVQMPPVANAGIDRIVSDKSVVMLANENQGATGTWSIIHGKSGNFTNINSPYSEFSGTDSLYTLVWSLTNICGTGSDTINVKFIKTIYRNNIVVVDSTDNIISDSTQMANGLYIIKFNTPVPTINDTTVLLGLVNEGFIRKVDSFTIQTDTFKMHTSQGNLEQITEYGSFNLARVFGVDTLLNTKAGNAKMLNRCPTRLELLNDPRYKTGNYYYIVENKPMYLRKGVSVSKTKSANSGNALINLDFNSTIFNQGGASLTLTGNYKLTPNLIAEIDYKRLHLNTARIGMSNGKISRNYKLDLSVSSSVNIFERNFTLLSLHKNIIFVIGGVPIWIRAKFNIDGQVSSNANASMNILHQYTKTSTYNAIIQYENNNWNFIYNKSSQVQNNNSFSVQGDLTQTFNIGPDLTFKVYGILGPYIDTKLTEELNLCTYNTNWKANMNLGGQISVGAKAEVLGSTLFDVAKTWSQSFYNLQFPYNIEMISGNNQVYNLGNPLNHKIKIRVLSNKGFAIPGAMVNFTPQNGGTVSTNTIIADANGYAQTTWTPGGANQSQLQAYILDCDGNNINNSPVIFNAYETSSNSNNCNQSSLYLSINNSGGNITPIAHMGVPPYTYSTDGMNYNSSAPQITPTAGQTYYFYVKDNNNCVASNSYSTAKASCVNSDLTLTLTVNGNFIHANASNGMPPYQYAIDDTTNRFSSSNIFTANAGNHTIYLKDDYGCIATAHTYIYNSNGGNDTVTDIDGNTYPVVQIGNQIWMAENLKVTHYPNGDTIPLVTNYAQWPNLANNNTDDAYSYYNNNTSGEANIYGALYTYAAAIGDNWQRDNSSTDGPGGQGICPDGWHLPSDAEWNTLVNYLGGNDVAGGKMKEAGTSHWRSPNTGADNSSGFSALPGGDGSGASVVGYYGGWWSSTVVDSSSAYGRGLSFNSAEVSRYYPYKSNGTSVRCVRD